MKKARVRVVLGVLMGLCFWLGWTSASWGDDDAPAAVADTPAADDDKPDE